MQNQFLHKLVSNLKIDCLPLRQRTCIKLRQFFKLHVVKHTPQSVALCRFQNVFSFKSGFYNRRSPLSQKVSFVSDFGVGCSRNSKLIRITERF